MTQTITPRTDTETAEDSKSVDHQTGRPTGHSRTIGAAIAATVLAATGLLAYRAIEGSSQPTAPADTSHETAEHERQLSQVTAANVDPNLNPHVNPDAAEYAQMERLADDSIGRSETTTNSQFLP